jgi:hypothetical protein
MPHLVRQTGGDARTRVPSGVPSAVGPQMNSQIHWVLKGQTHLAGLGHTGERPRAELAPPNTRTTWHAKRQVFGSRWAGGECELDSEHICATTKGIEHTQPLTTLQNNSCRVMHTWPVAESPTHLGYRRAWSGQVDTRWLPASRPPSCCAAGLLEGLVHLEVKSTMRGHIGGLSVTGTRKTSGHRHCYPSYLHTRM